MDAASGGNALLFAEWRYDPIQPALSRREASGAWRAVPLGSRALNILGLLLKQRGAVLSRDGIIQAVWPETTVEPNNLSVQIATLRRVLDDGRPGPSLIQTVPGQGYRLACVVEFETSRAVELDVLGLVGTPTSNRRGHLVGLLCGTPNRMLALRLLALAVVGVLVVWSGWSITAPPRLSIVCISFEDLSDSKTSSPFARSLSEQVAADLVHFYLFGLPRKVVIDPGPGMTDPATLRQSGARYVLHGKLHRLDAAMRADLQLVNTQTGLQLWSQRLEIGSEDAVDAQREAVHRIVSGAGAVILAAEVHRRQQKRPDQPTANDLLLQAKLVAQLPPSPQRLLTERDLYERAYQREPSSVFLKGMFAILLMDSEDYNPTGFKTALERAGVLVSDVRTATPNSQMALRTYAQWLNWQDGRCPETIEAARKLADVYPDNVQAERWLAQCLVLTGRAEEALPWVERAIRTAGLNDSWQFSNFRTKGDVLLDLGRFKEAIDWYQRALAANPDIGAESQFRRLIRIASAQAFDGNIADARLTMTRAEALWPYWTVRAEAPSDPRSAASLARTLRLQEGLRLAGLRDHADEEADFGVAPITTLQQASGGYTSKTLPGATTLLTAEVARLILGGKVIIIDAVSRNSGRSLPGAIGLRYVGAGGSLSDLAQDHLRRTMQELTKGDLGAAILAVGWNSEHFDGVDLTLRLVALGYRNVFWYRGGREAWEASGAPETLLTIRDW